MTGIINYGDVVSFCYCIYCFKITIVTKHMNWHDGYRVTGYFFFNL